MPSKGDQSCLCLIEAASIEIEGAQLVVEIDMQPFTFAGSGTFHRRRDECRTDPTSAAVLGDHCVENEGVGTPIPGDIDEADESVVVVCADPAQAVSMQLGEPVDVHGRVAEAFGMQGFDSRAVDVTSPFICDGHARIVAPGSMRYVIRLRL